MAEPVSPSSTRQRPLPAPDPSSSEPGEAPPADRKQQIRDLTRQIQQLQAEEKREEAAAAAPAPAGFARERGRHRFQMKQSEPTLRDPNAQRDFRAWDEPLPEPPAPFIRRIPTWVLTVFCLVFSAQFAVVGYKFYGWLARRTSEPAAQTSPREWNEALTRDLDRILSDFTKNRRAEARQATAALLAKAPGLPGLALLEAEAARSEGRWVSVDVFLQGEQQRRTGFSYRAMMERARNFAIQGKVRETIDCLRDAVAYDPTRPEAHFYIGEILRRMGRFTDAIATFERAAHAAQAGQTPDLALIRLRQRIAIAESGRDNAVQAECAAALAEPAPAPEWLTLDAALKLLSGNVSETRASLVRLKASCPPARLAVLLDDHVFRSLLNRTELRDLLPKRDLRDRSSLSFLPPP